MPKSPASWPTAVLPRRLTREFAAYYCGISPNTFDTKVEKGTYPQPDPEGKYDLKLLDQAIDRESGIAEASNDSEDWTIKRHGQNHPAGRQPGPKAPL